MDLKMEAAKNRTSVAEVVRTKVLNKKTSKKDRSTKLLMKKFDKIAGEIDEQNKGINLSERLIEMRYEQ